MNVAVKDTSESSTLLFKDKAIDKIIDRQRGQILAIKQDDKYIVIGGIINYRAKRKQTRIEITLVKPIIKNGVITDIE